MAKGKVLGTTTKLVSIEKRTSQGGVRPKMSSMNKHKKRNYKKYRGQGR
jgi:hypothetical protein